MGAGQGKSRSVQAPSGAKSVRILRPEPEDEVVFEDLIWLQRSVRELGIAAGAGEVSYGERDDLWVELLKRMRKAFEPGSRVILGERPLSNKANDYWVGPGSVGRVNEVDKEGMIQVTWENGVSAPVTLGHDFKLYLTPQAAANKLSVLRF